MSCRYDMDAITPAPARRTVHDNHDDHAASDNDTPRRSFSSVASASSTSSMSLAMPGSMRCASTDPLDARLWQHMLAVQRQHHCYRSARMCAALALADAAIETVVPPRACLDLMNDGMDTDVLTEAEQVQVFALLQLPRTPVPKPVERSSSPSSSSSSSSSSTMSKASRWSRFRPRF